MVRAPPADRGRGGGRRRPAIGPPRSDLPRPVGAPGGRGTRRWAADARHRPGALVRRAAGAGGDPPRRDHDLLPDDLRDPLRPDDHEHRAPRAAAAEPVDVAAGPGDGWLRRSVRRRRLRDLPLLLEGPDDGIGDPRPRSRHAGGPGRVREGAIRLFGVPPGASRGGDPGRPLRRKEARADQEGGHRRGSRVRRRLRGAGGGGLVAGLGVGGALLAGWRASPRTPRS